MNWPLKVKIERSEGPASRASPPCCCMLRPSNNGGILRNAVSHAQRFLRLNSGQDWTGLFLTAPCLLDTLGCWLAVGNLSNCGKWAIHLMQVPLHTAFTSMEESEGPAAETNDPRTCNELECFSD